MDLTAKRVLKMRFIKLITATVLLSFISIANAQTLTYSHGKYEGEVLNGRAHGYGTYTSANSGTVYTGQFITDTFDGYGTMTWTDGSKFVGKWQNDVGVSGTMTYANGYTSSGVVRSGVFTLSASQSQQQSQQQSQSQPSQPQSVQSQTVQQRTEAINSGNKKMVFSPFNDIAASYGIPANIDTQVRNWILQKFGGVEIVEYGDRIERQLGGVVPRGKNIYGEKYNDYQYYVYTFYNYVTRTNSKGEFKGYTSGYSFKLDVIMKSNGQINEFKWTETRDR